MDRRHQTKPKRKSKMRIDELYPSRFLRFADLDGKPMRVTISGIAREDVFGELKAIMSFTDGTKQLILNKTNARAIARILGDETTTWGGRDIMLVPAQVPFKGDIVDAIRVKPAPARKTARKDEPPPFDDDFEDAL
jgi:hypothetical protein